MKAYYVVVSNLLIAWPWDRLALLAKGELHLTLLLGNHELATYAMQQFRIADSQKKRICYTLEFLSSYL